MKHGAAFVAAGLLALSLSVSCKSMALNMAGDALSGNQAGDVFTGDDDPELVGSALPFAVKMYEALLAANPKHQGLIVMTGSLYIMYANAFVQGPAEQLPVSRNLERAAAKARAENLYLRGADILYDGLEKRYPGICKTFFPEGESGGIDEAGRKRYLGRLKKADTALVYWTAAATLSAYSLAPLTNVALGLRIPALMALVERVYELDPGFNNGALDDFLVLVYGSLPDFLGGDAAKAVKHYALAVEKSGGASAGPHVSYAQAVAVPAQDYETFQECLEKALAVDVDAYPSKRLENILAQRKARYLLDNAILFFADIDAGDEWDWGEEDEEEFEDS
jgi:predicted anti-sigma-YlaC factor YlaD